MGGAAQPDVPFEPTCVVSLPIHVFTIELMPGSGTINRESVREIFFFISSSFFFFFRKRRCSAVRFMGMERWTGSHLWFSFRDSSVIDGYDGSRWIERFLLWNFIQWAAEVGEIRIEAGVVLVRLEGLKIIIDSKKNGKCKFFNRFLFSLYLRATLPFFFFPIFIAHSSTVDFTFLEIVKNKY